MESFDRKPTWALPLSAFGYAYMLEGGRLSQNFVRAGEEGFGHPPSHETQQNDSIHGVSGPLMSQLQRAPLGGTPTLQESVPDIFDEESLRDRMSALRPR